MRAMIVGLLGLGALLAGCGPSALEQRVCEMWTDEGGSVKRLEQYRALSTAQIAELKGEAAEQWAYGFMANQQAAARVSRRLSISVREVNEALKKCRVAETA